MGTQAGRSQEYSRNIMRVTCVRVPIKVPLDCIFGPSGKLASTYRVLSMAFRLTCMTFEYYSTIILRY